METTTLIIAIWGAVLSTSLGLFEFYKWRRSSHPRLDITANGPMVFATAGNLLPAKKFVVYNITNVGDRPVTVSLVSYRFFKQKPWSFRKNPDERGLITPTRWADLPKKLEVGDTWTDALELTG